MKTQILLKTGIPKLALLWLFVFLGTVSKPSRGRRIYFILSCGAFTSILFSRPLKPQLPVIHYFIGLAAANLMCQASDFIFLNEPQLTLRRKDQQKPANELGLWERVSWANDLISNQRGVHWNFEAPGLRRSTKTRWPFVLEKLVECGYSYLILDFTSYAMRNNPVFQQQENESMSAQGVLWQTWNVMGFWTILFSFTKFSYAFSSAFCVLVGEWDPQDCPDYVGSVTSTTTVRKFWGRTWHQALRRMLSAHGKYVANTYFQYPKGSFNSAYTQLFVAFFISGLIHGAADFVAIHDVHRFVRNMQYFVLQAVAILFEDTIIAYGKKLGIKSVPRAIGYVWVVAWMVWSGPIWLETLVTEKLTNFILPFSVLDMIS